MNRVVFWAIVVLGIMFAYVSIGDAQANTRRVSASCYGPGLWGNKTASGIILRPTTIGAAHRTQHLGRNIVFGAGRKRAAARIIDRGPYVPGREYDLTQALVQRLGYINCQHFGVRTIMVTS